MQTFSIFWIYWERLGGSLPRLGNSPPRFRLLFGSGAVRAVLNSIGILALRYCPGFGRLSIAFNFRPALVHSRSTCFSSWMRRQRRRSRHASPHEAWSWSWRTADNMIAPTDVSQMFYPFLFTSCFDIFCFQQTTIFTQLIRLFSRRR